MRRLPLLLSLVAVFGCSDAATDPSLVPTDTDVVGTFSLTLSNGRPLPIVARRTNDEEWDITSDQFVIAADNTWNETTNYRVTSFVSGTASTQSTISSGTYTIANGQINFVMAVGGTSTFTGSVSGKSLTILYSGAQFFYTR